MRLHPSWHRPNTFVAFGDMLGFRRLVEHRDANERRLMLEHERIQGQIIVDPREWESIKSRRAKRGSVHSRLEQQFVLFNTIFNHHISDWKPEGKLTAIAFSDSFFVASDDGRGLLTWCSQLLAAMTLNDIPVRMGIARGSFCLDEDLQHITENSRRIYTIRFLGKGVVRAYMTESSGLKGMRIGLHSSVVDSIPQLVPHAAIPLPKSDARPGCRHELNYLIPFLLETKTARLPDMVRQHVNSMARRLPPGSRGRKHYERTIAALSRMSRAAGLGKKPRG